METVKRLNYLIGGYLAVLILLLLSVVAMPLMIRHSLVLTHTLVIEEEALETILIIALFGVSYLILKGFRRTLKSYERAVVRAGDEKSKLVSRLAEAFSYIGTVNIEIKEIQSILCGVENYPQTRKEYKQLIDSLARKAMAVAGSPWIVVRMISRSCGRTLGEHAVDSPEAVVPPVTMGNREILEGLHVDGLRAIRSRQKNLDLLTVCIFPAIPLSEEYIVLITAITNQIEMLFMLYRAGCIHRKSFNDPAEKEICHATHH